MDESAVGLWLPLLSLSPPDWFCHHRAASAVCDSGKGPSLPLALSRGAATAVASSQHPSTRSRALPLFSCVSLPPNPSRRQPALCWMPMGAAVETAMERMRGIQRSAVCSASLSIAALTYTPASPARLRRPPPCVPTLTGRRGSHEVLVVDLCSRGRGPCLHLPQGTRGSSPIQRLFPPQCARV